MTSKYSTFENPSISDSSSSPSLVITSPGNVITSPGNVPLNSKEEGQMKALNRAVAEGYRYQSLKGSLSETDEDEPNDEKKNRRHSRKQWKKIHTIYLALLVVLLILICILVGVIAYQYLSYSNKNVCTDASCVQTSAYITSKMDLTANPCEDFYQYTCGNWESTVVIPDTRSKYGTFQEIADNIMEALKKIITNPSVKFKGVESTAVRKLKEHYQACLDIDTINRLDTKPVLQLIEDLGSWSLSDINGKTRSNDSWTLLDGVLNNHRLEFGGLFSMAISNDQKNSTVNIISFDQSGLTLESYEMYNTSHEKQQELRTAFVEFSTKVATYLGGNETYARHRMEEIYSFEQELAAIFVPDELLMDPVKNYHRMMVADFQKIVGHKLNILDYLQRFVNESILDSEEIIVFTPEYFEKLGSLLEKTNDSLLADYFVWGALSSVMGYLPDRFVDAALILQKAESGVSKLDPRWLRCIQKADEYFGFASGALYVQDYFPESSKEEVTNILEMVRAAFVDNLDLVQWMDTATKVKAREKALAIMTKIAYPDWILDPVKLDEHYENVTIGKDTFFANMLSYHKWQVDDELNKYGNPPDPERWSMTPSTVNAYYTPTYNTIAFPAGILQRPFYDPRFPKSFNFGTVGMIIGHEMTHGFDNNGRNYDQHGNMVNWWSEGSAESFKDKKQCMIQQYSQYQINGTHLNGIRTQGENIADNGGVKMGYRAFKKWQSAHSSSIRDYPGIDLTPDQLFFVGFGQLWCAYYTPAKVIQSVLVDPHSISKFRVQGVVSNSPEFSRAFDCPMGSPMNPKDKCTVW